MACAAGPGHTWPKARMGSEQRWVEGYNPLTTVATSKLLEMIGRATYILACLNATALHSDINQTAGLGGHQSM